ncbi:GATA zinc finger domain-containing protein 14-like, partial [Argonauta hians]
TPTMEKLCMTTSLKDIPIPNQDEYVRILIQKINEFIDRVRWMVFFAHPANRRNNSDVSDNPAQIPGLFKSRRTPPFDKDLEAFERDLLKLVSDLKFKGNILSTDPHLAGLSRTLKLWRSSDELIVRSDKTNNLYLVPIDRYLQLLRNELLNSYRTVPETTLTDINKELYDVFERRGLLGKTEPVSAREPRILLKDHKANFSSNPSVRLICPSSSDIGLLSKAILDRILPVIQRNCPDLDSGQLKLWNDTWDALDWFNDLQGRGSLSFVQFDLVSYYQSVTPQLLESALGFASEFSDLAEDEARVIRLARKTIISFDGKLWARKDTQDLFNVAMGSSDSAQVTDLIGLLVLRTLGTALGAGVSGGLYRDDGLLVVRDASRVELERIRKKIRESLEPLGLSATFALEEKVVNFLDAALYLDSGRFTPYRKPNECTRYVSAASNHPPKVLEAIPQSIGKRLSKLSADEETFNLFKASYQDALTAAGHRTPLVFNPEDHEGSDTQRTFVIPLNGQNSSAPLRSSNWATQQDGSNTNSRPRGRRQRSSSNRPSGHSRNQNNGSAWFTPPFNKGITVSLAKCFFGLIDKHFPRGHRLANTLNRHSLRFSYSVMPNMETMLNRTNN